MNKAVREKRILRGMIGLLAVCALLTVGTGCDQGEAGIASGHQIIVGKRSYAWTDTNRVDPYYGGQRIINVQLWYPTQVADTSTLRMAEYLPNIELAWRELDNWTSQDFKEIAAVKTGSRYDAPISVARPNYPVLLFSPSLGGNASYYTYYAEVLARSGYIVVGINHRYESEFVVDEHQEVYPLELRYHDSIEQIPIPAQISADQFRELKSERMKVLGEDLLFCLDQLAAINAAEFQNKLDFNRVGAWGHSIGGAAATYASLQDPRIHAVLNMDGTPPTAGMEQGLEVPFMYLEDLTDYKNHPGYRKQYDRRSSFCEKGKAAAFRVLMADINHNSFMDVNYFLSQDPEEKAKLEKDLQLFLHYLAGFFDHYLRGKPLDLPPVKTDTLEVIAFPEP